MCVCVCVAENVCIGFARSVYVVQEEVGYVQVCVKILCPEQVQRDGVFVQLTTTGVSASEGSLCIV